MQPLALLSWRLIFCRYSFNSWDVSSSLKHVTNLCRNICSHFKDGVSMLAFSFIKPSASRYRTTNALEMIHFSILNPKRLAPLTRARASQPIWFTRKLTNTLILPQDANIQLGCLLKASRMFSSDHPHFLNTPTFSSHKDLLIAHLACNAMPKAEFEGLNPKPFTSSTTLSNLVEQTLQGLYKAIW